MSILTLSILTLGNTQVFGRRGVRGVQHILSCRFSAPDYFIHRQFGHTVKFALSKEKEIPIIFSIYVCARTSSHRDRQRNKGTDRQIHSQTDRQTESQSDGHTDSPTFIVAIARLSMPICRRIQRRNSATFKLAPSVVRLEQLSLRPFVDKRTLLGGRMRRK